MRQTGRYASFLKGISDAISDGKRVMVPGIDERGALEIQGDLEAIGCKSFFAPVTKQPRAEIAYDLRDPEFPPLGFKYFDPKITGYTFSQAQTTNQPESHRNNGQKK